MNGIILLMDSKIGNTDFRVHHIFLEPTFIAL